MNEITDYVIQAENGQFVCWSDIQRWHLRELNSAADGADDFDTPECAGRIAQMLSNVLGLEMQVLKRAW